MNCIERIDLTTIQYLKSLKFPVYKQLLTSSTKSEKDLKTQYDILGKFCDELIKGKGEFKRTYHHTLNTSLEVGGRLFCGGSIQGLPKDIRGVCFRNTTTDIDMKNAHPVILKYICKKHNISCPNLSYYIENRETILEAFDNKEDGKTAFLKAVNNDKINKKIKNKFFLAFDKECKEIQKEVTSIIDYSEISKSVPASKLYNWYGSAINRILCFYENKILQAIIDTLAFKEIEIAALMFDGLMVYGNFYNDKILLDELENVINKAFDGLNMKLSYKEHSTHIQVPENFAKTVENVTNVEMNSFEKVAKEFEKAHCKIINKSIFIKEIQDEIIVLTKPELITSYEHLTYDKFNAVKDEWVKTNFINDWLKNNDNQRCKDDVGVFPCGLICPPTTFNLWRKFEMEFVTEYQEKPDELAFIKNHIKILCGNDEIVADYFIKWIAQMIQYPAVKSICPTLISKQGAGKGTLLKLLGKMLGNNKVFETRTPSRDVWGDFNGRMSNTFLVNLDELSKKETIESEGEIKGLITEPKLTINLKGKNQYEIQSYHRFITTTNNEEPLNTTKDDRRNIIIRSSDEKCGDKEYFNEINRYLDDVNVIKTCYEYFKSIPDMDKFNTLPIPITEYHKGLQELKRSPIECWIYDLVEKNVDKVELDYSSQKCYDLFTDWCSVNCSDYKCSKIQFCVRLGRLNLNGICVEKGKSFNKTIFDIKKLKTLFGIGCLLIK